MVNGASSRLAAVAILAACFQASVHARPPARRALLIGIEDYSASRLRGTPPPVRRDLTNLEGAVDDAEAMRDMLVARYGFDRRDIVLLTNERATRRAILEAIVNHLTQAAVDGDIAVFYFAGHGSQVPNPLSTEPDRRDESIVPADSRVGARDIRDKELRRLFNAVIDRGAQLTVILDNCNSASGTRGLLTGARIRALRPDPRPVADGANDGGPPEDRGALIIAAAQDYELARETRDGATDRGVFSSAFIRAMQAADDHEPAIEIFLRAQAILRGEAADQQPVIAGTEEARQRPLFGVRRQQKPRDVFLSERVRADGRVVLQGGWAHGLTVGSQLVDRRDRSTRIEVAAMIGLGRSEARILSAPRRIEPGTLFEIASWAAPPGRPLRVCMPRASRYDAVVTWTRELARLAARKKIRWIADPSEETPTHVLRLSRGKWELVTRNGAVTTVGSAAPLTTLSRIPPGSALFVQLPAPASLVKAIDVGPGTSREAIQPVDRAEDADFVLTGRLVDDVVSYAWVRPLVSNRSVSVFPSRTAWQGPNGAAALQYAVIRLRRIQAWQTLESPSVAAFAYGLTVRRERDRALVRAGVVVGNESYSLVLRARPSRPADQRFTYAFVIDSDGNGVLLFPLRGSVENRFPLRRGSAPQEIVLEPPFEVTEPYGVDTYFLLTTDEPLPNPWILQWDGVRSPPNPASPLEELLLRTAGLRQPARPIRIPSRWSIERIVLESAPASHGKERR